MFLAGYYCKKSLEHRDYKATDFWKNKLITFLVPFWMMVALWFVSARSGAPTAAFVSYASGLRFLSFPPEWDLFSLWFASALIGFYLIFSLVGRHKKVTVATIFTITVGSMIYFSFVGPDNRLIFWNFFYYLLPFTVGFFWKFGFTNRKVLLLAPALLLAPIVYVAVPVGGNLGTFLWIGVNWGKGLLLGLAMTMISLYLFSKVTSVKFSKVVVWVSAGSLIVYLMEPVWSMWTGWLLFPQYIGDSSVQFVLTPEQSALRLLVAIPLAFLVSPAIYRIYLSIANLTRKKLK
jgi:peptidoglycan/LPS O-acetylase OafA/YrhL